MSRRALSLAAAIGLTACATAPVTTGPLPGRLSPRETLVREVDSLISQPQFRSAQWGVLVVNPATGDTLVSRNPGKLFIPASNMKIVTSAVALTQLGADYRYRTTFATRGQLHDSVLDGDLIVIGRGDPTMSDRMRGNAMAAMDTIADSVARRGVRRITGALVSGGNAFPDSVLGFGWEWDDLGEYYAAGVDELFFNEGMAPTTLRPNGTRDSLYSGPGKDPDRAYLAALDSALAHRGIAVAGGVAPRSLDTLPSLDTLFVLWSPPMRDILPALLKPSQNQIAEILFKTIGLESGGLGTADSARKIVARQLLGWGAQPDGFVIRDGSGLSRHDLVSPETIVHVLAAIQRDTAFAAYYAALPIAGMDGTVKSRMKGTTAENNVHAKTGSLDGVRSLSGYVTTADGERLIFSILCNNYTTASNSVTQLADTIAASLASYRARRPQVLSPREASARILEEISALAAERVPTIESVGRVAAESIRATVTIPPWNNASMDGYAVRSTDVGTASAKKPVRLPVVAEIPAGKFPPRALAPGEAMRIMTGAPVPDGADSVVRIEDTDGGTQAVEIRSARDAGRNVRPAGEDFRDGDTLLERGSEITPAVLGVLLSGGVETIEVHRRPRVAIISSGDELVLIEDFGEVKAGRRIVSTNSYTLPALVREAGGKPFDFGIAADTRESLATKLEQARDCDLIVTSAGVSVGDLDYTRDVFESLGGQQKFWKVRIRPGAPLAFGMLGSVPWIGLSGNPVSAVVTFELFVRPVIRKMLGHSLLFRRPLPVTLEEDVTISADLTHFHRAVVTRAGDGNYSARLTRSQSSASLSSLASANALLVVPPEQKHYAAGSTLNALPLRDYPFELSELEL